MMRATDTAASGFIPMSDVHHYIQGKATEGASSRWGDVYNPATGEKIRGVG